MTTNFFVKRFLKASWLGKAKQYASNPAQLLQLLAAVRMILRKAGLKKIRHKLQLLAAYVKDIATGRYKDYSTSSLLLIVATLIYVVTPVDFIPDFIPAGWIDDVSIVTWAFGKLTNELRRYEEYRNTGSRQSEADSHVKKVEHNAD